MWGDFRGAIETLDYLDELLSRVRDLSAARDRCPETARENYASVDV